MVTGLSLRNHRQALGLSQAQLARVLGYTARRQMREAIGRMERARKPVPALVARLVSAYADGYRPADWPGKGA